MNFVVERNAMLHPLKKDQSQYIRTKAWALNQTLIEARQDTQGDTTTQSGVHESSVFGKLLHPLSLLLGSYWA